MLLVVDTGNTNTVFAVFDKDELKGKWRLSANRNRTADEYAVALTQFLQLEGLERGQIKNVIIASVVPQNIFSLKMLCRNYLNCEPLIVGESNVKLNIEVKIDRPSEVGADRLVNSVAAFNKYGGNAIIIDFGTATTFDVIGKNGEYLGGVISPGINLSIDALHRAAAKLPEVDVARPKKVIGTSTVSAMQSGVFWGYIGLIEGITERIQKEYGAQMKVLATGGLAPLFAGATNKIEHLESDLTIYGLKQIYENNK
ncbi:MAG: type pantothenate kinase [Rickettsiaceae bacterium]|jgi:type III pantothenate kinase|nr:type pantothenate kinase [Rickettsiaceae bacterium]